MLTPLEIKQLRQEHEGYVVDFGVFLREKLMGREAITLSKPMDPEVRKVMTDLLKMCGSMTLIAKRTEYNVLISTEFTEIAAKLRMAVQKAHYSVNELVLSKNLIPKLICHVKDLRRTILDLQNESGDIEVIINLLDCVSQMGEILNGFAGQFGLSEE